MHVQGTRRFKSLVSAPVTLGLLITSLAACGDDETTETTDSQITTAGYVSSSGGSSSGDVASSSDGSSSSGGEDTETTGSLEPCDTCPSNYLCKHDVCIPNLGPCEGNGDCPGDSYCDEDGICVPYGVPEDQGLDPECKKEDLPDGVKPELQCEWEGPQPADATAAYTHIYSMPVVANLNLSKGTGASTPSIIATTWRDNGGMDRYGMLRVFDGRTCDEQMRAGGPDLPEEEMLADWPTYGTQWAVADLDLDLDDGGHPEIIGIRRVDPDAPLVPANLYAFSIDSSGDEPVLTRAWYGRDCMTESPVGLLSSYANHGPSVLDLDDDGLPEVLVDNMVFDNEGCLLNEEDEFVYTDVGLGLMSTAADVDLDGLPELVRFDRVARWDPDTTEWVDEDYWDPPAPPRAGHVGVANFGAYSQIEGAPEEDLPEVVVISASLPDANAEDTGFVRLQDLNGATVWGPVALYAGAKPFGGRGGPPTISDFDGDGQVEFATAGAYYFAVYDPDCEAALNGESPAQRPGGACERSPEMADLPDGVLWAQPSQDFSSNITGSSIFDFDGDGVGEAVYRDECYLRVYNGASGEVVFSSPASSGTGMEYPVIADVDGDFATEIVVARGADLEIDCPLVDPLFPGSGQFEPNATGFAVLRDPLDRWAMSRPVWNQHAYSITHVTDDARVPKSSEVEVNWLDPELNNFRQNVQGEFGVLALADITVELIPDDELCRPLSGEHTISAEVCNRGTAPAGPGIGVEILQTENKDDPYYTGELICSTQTTQALPPDTCELVACTGEFAGGGNIHVKVDPDDELADCHPNNNVGADALTICPED